jgi:hypothetical protein
MSPESRKALAELAYEETQRLRAGAAGPAVAEGGPTM